MASTRALPTPTPIGASAAAPAPAPAPGTGGMSTPTGPAASVASPVAPAGAAPGTPVATEEEKVTSPDATDAALDDLMSLDAEAKAEQEAAVAAEAAAKARTAEIIADVMKRLTKAPAGFTLDAPNRMFIKEGIVRKKDEGGLIKRSSDRHLYLFSDLLLVTTDQKKALEFHQAVDLASTTLEDLLYATVTDSSLPENSFRLNSSSRSFVLFCDNATDKQAWMTALFAAITRNARDTPGQPRVSGIGWQHQLVQGTIWSAAVQGKLHILEDLIKLALAEEGQRVGLAANYMSFSINDVDAEGRTALHYAVACKHRPVVQALLTAGAIPNMCDPSSRTPVHYAIKAGDFEILTLLSDFYADMNAEDVLGHTPLYYVALLPDTETAVQCLRTLFLHGANLNVQDPSGISPLRYFMEQKRVDLIIPMFDCEANVNVLDHMGRSLLHVACSLNDMQGALSPEVIEKLLQVGVSPNLVDARNRSPLHELIIGLVAKDPAAEAALDSIAMCLFILARGGARSNIPDAQGQTVDVLLTKLGQQRLITAMSTGAAAHAAAAPPAAELVLPHQFPHANPQPDSAYTNCQHCRAGFTLTKRRHHCRFCGYLLCGDCSNKKSPMRSAPNGGPEVSRVCNGCFNRLCFECARGPVPKLKFEVMPAKPLPAVEASTAAGAAAPAPPPRKAGSSAEADRAALFGTAGRDPAPRAKDSDTKAADTGVGEVQNVLAETRDRLNERGERLARLANATVELNDRARGFEEAARQMRLQAEKNSSWW